MPLRQSFAGAGEFIDTAKPLREALQNVDQTFTLLSREQEDKRRYGIEEQQRVAALAEDKRRYEESLKFKQADEERAVAADNRAQGAYDLALRDREALSNFYKGTAADNQTVSGVLNPTTVDEARAIDSISVFGNKDKGYTDTNGNVISEDEASKRLVSQTLLGASARSPMFRETDMQEMNRLGATIGMTPDIQKVISDKATEESKDANELIKVLTNDNKDLYKQENKLKVDVLNTAVKSGKVSKEVAKAVVDIQSAEANYMDMVGTSQLFGDGSEIKDIFNKVKTGEYDLKLTERALQRSIDSGALDNSVDGENFVKYYNEEKNSGGGSTYNVDIKEALAALNNEVKRQTGELSSKQIDNNKRIQALSLGDSGSQNAARKSLYSVLAKNDITKEVATGSKYSTYSKKDTPAPQKISTTIVPKSNSLLPAEKKASMADRLVDFLAPGHTAANIAEGAAIAMKNAKDHPLETAHDAGLGILNAVPSLVSGVGDIVGYETPTSDSISKYLEGNTYDPNSVLFAAGSAAAPIGIGVKAANASSKILGAENILNRTRVLPGTSTVNTIDKAVVKPLLTKAKDTATKVVNNVKDKVTKSKREAEKARREATKVKRGADNTPTANEVAKSRLERVVKVEKYISRLRDSAKAKDLNDAQIAVISEKIRKADDLLKTLK